MVYISSQKFLSSNFMVSLDCKFVILVERKSLQSQTINNKQILSSNICSIRCYLKSTNIILPRF